MSVQDSQAKCVSCGGVRGTGGTETMIVCQYCGTETPRPLPVGIRGAAQVQEAGPPAPPPDPEWVQEIRDEINAMKRRQTSLLMRLLASVFMILLPGIAIALGGGLASGLSGNVRLMIIVIPLGIVVGACGIISIVFHGIMLGQGKRAIQMRTADLGSRGFRV